LKALTAQKLYTEQSQHLNRLVRLNLHQYLFQPCQAMCSLERCRHMPIPVKLIARFRQEMCRSKNSQNLICPIRRHHQQQEIQKR
jgi:hypothetical protein